MNKWQQTYSALKEVEDALKEPIYFTDQLLMIIVSALLMLVEDKLHEKTADN